MRIAAKSSSSVIPVICEMPEYREIMDRRIDAARRRSSTSSCVSSNAAIKDFIACSEANGLLSMESL